MTLTYKNRRITRPFALKNLHDQIRTEQQRGSRLLHAEADDGSTAESTRNNGKPAPFRLGDTLPSGRLEQQLLGLKEGEKRPSLSLTPLLRPSPDLIQYFSRREFIDARRRAGDRRDYAFYRNDGKGMPGVICEANCDSITVDFNYPLAGRNCSF